MKKKLFFCLLFLEAISCLLVFSTSTAASADVLSFPWGLLSLGLRQLSLHSPLGNIIAWVLYIGISLLPSLLLLWMLHRRSWLPEDFLLPMLTVLSFLGMFLMINPSYISVYLGTGAALAGIPFINSCLTSIFLAYVLFRILRYARTAPAVSLYRCIRIFLHLLMILLVAVICAVLYGDLLTTLRSQNGVNTLTYLFIFIQFLVNAIPYALDLWICQHAIIWTESMQQDRYCENAVQGAETLSRCCFLTLLTSIAINLGFNLLQLLLSPALQNIQTSVQLPLPSLLLVFALMLAARYVRDNHLLKTENDLFI